LSAALLLPGCYTAATPLPGQRASYESLQEAYERLLWPTVQARPLPEDGNQVVPAPALAQLQATLDLPPADQVSRWLESRCAEAALPAAELVAFADPARPARAWPVAAEARDAFLRLQSFSAYWMVDVVHFMEDPEVGPDAEIYEALPHYVVTKRDLMDLAELVGLEAGSDAELLRPEVMALERQAARHAIEVILDFKRAHAEDQFSALSFAGWWLGIDWSRYMNIYDSGLPRFGWLAWLNDMKLDQADHIWSQWTFNDDPLAEVEAEFAALEADLAAVQALWRARLEGRWTPGDEAVAAAAVCAARAELDEAVRAAAGDSAKAKNNLANRLHEKLMVTMRFAQTSPNTRLH
jgi:hypothetical protein